MDLVPDMSASTFIRSFKRFSSRRGLPAPMISDNGKAFEAAAKVIKDVVYSPEVQRYFDGVGIEWKFNIPRALFNQPKDLCDQPSVAFVRLWDGQSFLQMSC